ncbi:MAG: hypothetical protein QXH26_00080 [Candidatus Hadarchaeales archaeon]
MDRLIDVVLFSTCLALCLLLLLPSRPPSNPPNSLARSTLLTLLEARPKNFHYALGTQDRGLRFKSYGQLLVEFAVLGSPPQFGEELRAELRNTLDGLLPFGYRLSLESGSVLLEVGNRENGRRLVRESVPLLLPSVPPSEVELVLELFA